MQSYGQVSVSNTIGDSRANPYNVVDPNGYGWWAPPVDVSHAWIQISFDRPYICEKIMIKWKLNPPKYELQIMGQDQKWVTQKFEVPSDDVELELSPQELLGVKILMLNLDERGGAAEIPIYGIRKIQIIRPGTPVMLQTCGSQVGTSKIMNRWKVEEVEYINIAFKVPYDKAQQYLNQQY